MTGAEGNAVLESDRELSHRASSNADDCSRCTTGLPASHNQSKAFDRCSWSFVLRRSGEDWHHLARLVDKTLYLQGFSRMKHNR